MTATQILQALGITNPSSKQVELMQNTIDKIKSEYFEEGYKSGFKNGMIEEKQKK